MPWYNAKLTVDYAIGKLSRAQSAQTPDEVVYYLTMTKDLLPIRGPVVWWSPEKTNFASVQADLDELIMRATSISTLKLGDELFNSEMYSMHAEIETIQETLLEF